MDNGLCQELVYDLENVKKYQLQKDEPVITVLIDLVGKHQIKDMRLLNDIAEALLAVRTGSYEGSSFELTPQSLLDAEILEKEIASWVGEIRKEFFGNEGSPFSNRDLAVEWLSKQSLNEEQIQSMKKSRDNDFSIVTIEGKIFTPTTTPAHIRSKTKSIAKATGINHPSLIMHVLANTKIICLKWDLITHESATELPSGSNTVIRTLEISFRDTLNFEDMRQLYNQIKRVLKFRKSKQISNKHLEIYRLVGEMGFPSGKGKVIFWENVVEKWNREHPQQAYSTWRGIRLAYHRILGRRSKIIQSGLPIFKDADSEIRVKYIGKEMKL